MSHEPTQQHLDWLIAALKRYGYTYVVFRYDDQVICSPAESKPYDVFLNEGVLEIVHRCCTGCPAVLGSPHTAAFLQEMIPVIGRLDAHAEYGTLGNSGYAPRLRISV